MQGAGCRVPGAVLGAGCAGECGAGCRCRVRRAACGGLLLDCAAGTSSARRAAAGGADVPGGEGADVVRRPSAFRCHGADLITSQRLTDAGWGRELDKMLRWGATCRRRSARRWSPTSPGTSRRHRRCAHADDGQGRLCSTAACLSCHGADLTEQQRLSPTGWTREVEKMMRWGAQLTDAEKTALVDYLAGPR